jgi:hypothetical protein
LIGEWLLQCPGCGSHADVEVEVGIYVRIFEDGSEPVDGTHEFGGTSPARCGACAYRDDFAAFRAFPAAVDTGGPVWFTWTDADGSVGSARWGTKTAQQISEVLDRLAAFWPGIDVTVAGVADGVTITTAEEWARDAGVDELIDEVNTVLNAMLGRPDTLG